MQVSTGLNHFIQCVLLPGEGNFSVFLLFTFCFIICVPKNMNKLELWHH